MSNEQTFTTTLILPDETEVEVRVEYTYYAGFNGSMIDPPEPASVEIQSVTPDVPAECYDTLVEEAFDHHADYLVDAAEWKAEMRRDY